MSETKIEIKKNYLNHVIKYLDYNIPDDGGSSLGCNIFASNKITDKLISNFKEKCVSQNLYNKNNVLSFDNVSFAFINNIAENINIKNKPSINMYIKVIIRMLQNVKNMEELVYLLDNTNIHLLDKCEREPLFQQEDLVYVDVRNNQYLRYYTRFSNLFTVLTYFYCKDNDSYYYLIFDNEHYLKNNTKAIYTCLLVSEGTLILSDDVNDDFIKSKNKQVKYSKNYLLRLLNTLGDSNLIENMLYKLEHKNLNDFIDADFLKEYKYDDTKLINNIVNIFKHDFVAFRDIINSKYKLYNNPLYEIPKELNFKIDDEVYLNLNNFKTSLDITNLYNQFKNKYYDIRSISYKVVSWIYEYDKQILFLQSTYDNTYLIITNDLDIIGDESQSKVFKKIPNDLIFSKEANDTENINMFKNYVKYFTDSVKFINTPTDFKQNEITGHDLANKCKLILDLISYSRNICSKLHIHDKEFIYKFKTEMYYILCDFIYNFSNDAMPFLIIPKVLNRIKTKNDFKNVDDKIRDVNLSITSLIFSNFANKIYTALFTNSYYICNVDFSRLDSLHNDNITDECNNILIREDDKYYIPNIHLVTTMQLYTNFDFGIKSHYRIFDGCGNVGLVLKYTNNKHRFIPKNCIKWNIEYENHVFVNEDYKLKAASYAFSKDIETNLFTGKFVNLFRVFSISECKEAKKLDQKDNIKNTDATEESNKSDYLKTENIDRLPDNSKVDDDDILIKYTIENILDDMRRNPELVNHIILNALYDIHAEKMEYSAIIYSNENYCCRHCKQIVLPLSLNNFIELSKELNRIKNNKKTKGDSKSE